MTKDIVPTTLTEQLPSIGRAIAERCTGLASIGGEHVQIRADVEPDGSILLRVREFGPRAAAVKAYLHISDPITDTDPEAHAPLFSSEHPEQIAEPTGAHSWRAVDPQYGVTDA